MENERRARFGPDLGATRHFQNQRPGDGQDLGGVPLRRHPVRRRTVLRLGQIVEGQTDV